MVSRILGMFRDIILASTFGGGGLMDAFLVAFKIPNFFRRLTAEGAMTQALLPLVVEVQTQQDRTTFRNFLAQIFFLLSLALGLATLFTLVFTEAMTFLFAAGLRTRPELFDLATSLLRITFPYLFFITLTAYYITLQYSRDHFRLAAQTPLVLNIVLIGAALYATPFFDPPIKALAWGVFAAGCLQLLVQLPKVGALGFPILPRLTLSQLKPGPYTRRFFASLLPALLSGSVVQINLLVDTLIASFLASGSISWLYFAERLIQLPIGVFGISIATILMPGLARLYQGGNNEDARQMLTWGIRLGLLLTLPAAVGLILFAEPILVTLYQYGSFSMQHIEQTLGALRAYAIGVPAFVLTKILTASFFARQNYRTPLKIAMIATLTGVVLSISLALLWQHVGLALATAGSGIVNASLLMFILMRARLFKSDKGFVIFNGQLLLALLVLIGLLLYLPQWFPLENWAALTIERRIYQLGLCILTAVVAYFAALFIAGLKWQTLDPRFH